jgi:predicted phage tail protein
MLDTSSKPVHRGIFQPVLAALILPSIAYLLGSLIVFHTGWETAARESLEVFNNPSNWATTLGPAMILVGVLNYVSPQKRMRINCIAFVLICGVVYMKYAGVYS